MLPHKPKNHSGTVHKEAPTVMLECDAAKHLELSLFACELVPADKVVTLPARYSKHVLFS